MQDPIAVDDSLVLDNVTIQQVLTKQLEDGSIGYMLESKTFREYTLGEYRQVYRFHVHLSWHLSQDLGSFLRKAHDSLI